MALYTSGSGKSHGRWDNASMLVNCLSNGRTKCGNVCCSYSMLNRLIDSREVRSQKAAQSSQTSGNSSICCCSKDELKIIRLKEAMRQRDEYYCACLAQQQAMLQISWVISLQLIKHLGIILVLILCITTCIANGGATNIWHIIVRSYPPPPTTTTTSVWLTSWSSSIYLISVSIFILSIYNLFH
jgi:hypothetical protein